MKSLAEFAPDLALQLHPTKNGDLKAEDISCWSTSKVWWLLPYDDPESGRHFEFEWEARVDKRYLGEGCPYLSGKRVYPGFNDLATKAPDIASEWHPTKNGTLTPRDVTVRSGRRVWWLLPYDDPETGRHFDFEWEATIDKRVSGRGCPYLAGKIVYSGFNDFETKAPELAKQWSPKNPKQPSETFAYSNKKVWWVYPYDDPVTGEHFDFEWEATPASRLKTPGCPFLSNQRVWPGFNDLQTKNPKLAAEWHPTQNGTLTPDAVMPNSREKAWWLYPYDDPVTGKHFDFEWQASVYMRNKGDGCPFLSNNGVWPGYNDLATLNPDLAKEWHPTKNRKLTPQNVSAKSNKKVWWLCPKCGKSYRMAISHRSEGQQCDCMGK